MTRFSPVLGSRLLPNDAPPEWIIGDTLIINWTPSFRLNLDNVSICWRLSLDVHSPALFLSQAPFFHIHRVRYPYTLSVNIFDFSVLLTLCPTITILGLPAREKRILIANTPENPRLGHADHTILHSILHHLLHPNQ